MDAVLEDYESADIDARLRATLGYLQTMTVAPQTLSAAHTQALRDAGVTHAAAIEAVEIGFAFNVINRLADSFDFDVPTPARFGRLAPMLFRMGYKV